jgi:probable rRNA maturation factor
VELLRTVAISNRHPRLKTPARAVSRAIALLDEHRERFRAGCPPGELSIAFLTDDALAGIHRDFMDDPTATDVITFEGDAIAGLAGEICVSADTARSYARAHGRKFAEELTLYVVHGWLHLAGYDDLQPAKKRAMRAAEKRAMQLLAEHDAIPGFKL